ncbi:MAG: heparin lyase I family protein [Bacteroidota bacterium]
MRKAFLFIIIAPALFSCHREAPEIALKSFSDDFERYSSINEMVGTADNQWTEFNINEEINVSAMPVTLDTTIVHSGNQSVRFHCLQTDPDLKEVCKCNLNKSNLYFKQGEIVYYSAWYYLQHPSMDYGTFFLWDLGEIVQGSQEIRVMAWEENLELERNKIGLANLFQPQPALLFPINRWARLEVEVKLSQYNKGYVKMWLDGNEIINKDKILTQPKDIANLVWGTKGYYERIQSGITAKGGTSELVLYMDDVEIRVK